MTALMRKHRQRDRHKPQIYQRCHNRKPEDKKREVALGLKGHLNCRKRDEPIKQIQAELMKDFLNSMAMQHSEIVAQEVLSCLMTSASQF